MSDTNRPEHAPNAKRPLAGDADALESMSTPELVALVRDLRRRAADLEFELESLRGRAEAPAQRGDQSASFVHSSSSAIIHCDLEGTITQWNPSAEALYGFTAAEAVGKKTDIVLVPSLRRERDRHIEALLAGEEVAPYETLRRSKTGGVIDVEVTLSPVRDATGAITGISMLERDLSDRKRSRRHEQKVIANEAAAKAAVDIVDAMREAVILLSLGGVVLSANPALKRLVGLNANDIVGKKLQDFLSDTFGEDDLARTTAALGRIQEEKVIELPSVAANAPDGSVVHVAPTVALVEPTVGEPASAILTLRDITNVRRYQNSLRILTERLAETEEQERLRISRYIHDMIVQSLSLSRIRLGTIERSLADCGRHDEVGTVQNVRALIDETIGQCRSVMSDLAPPLLYEVGLIAALEELTQKLESRSGTAIRLADEGLPGEIHHSLRSLLFQCTRELILNALKHAGECAVEVRLGGSDGTVYVQVRDNGRGFDLEAVESPLERESSFGLFNIRERIVGLGGQFDIRTRPGDGTVASISVPTSRL